MQNVTGNSIPVLVKKSRGVVCYLRWGEGGVSDVIEGVSDVIEGVSDVIGKVSDIIGEGLVTS